MKLSRRSIAATLALVAIASLAGCAKTGTKGGDKVRVILDWTPNTNHTGLYVAIDQGYYAKEGLDVEILPFSSSGVEPVLSSGGADFGISGSEALTFARASGQKLKSVFIIQQKPSLQLGVAANRDDIKSPKDLDGKIYAGFGLPFEQPIVRTVIKAAGGKGVFDAVSLSTSAYEAVYSKKADFALPLTTWEGIEGKLKGTPLKFFDPTEYGVPPSYQLLLAASDDYLAKHEAIAKRFLKATQKGYAYAVEHPKEAAAILIKQNPSGNLDAELVNESQAELSGSYWADAKGKVGYASPERWDAYTKFLFDAGVLTGADGKAINKAPAAAELFTNKYLP